MYEGQDDLAHLQAGRGGMAILSRCVNGPSHGYQGRAGWSTRRLVRFRRVSVESFVEMFSAIIPPRGADARGEG